MTLWLNDPAQELYLARLRDQRQQQQGVFEAFATDENAYNLSVFSTMFPQASSNLGLALTVGGIPASSPVVADLAQLEVEQRDVNGPIDVAGEGWWDPIENVLQESVVDPLVGGIRWGMSAFQALWDLTGGGAPIRAVQQARTENISMGEAWQQQQPALFTALGGVLGCATPRTWAPAFSPEAPSLPT
jgi:hypothetical protein